MPKNQEEVLRQYVHELKMLYQEIFISGGIFVVCLVIWMAGGGGFWPFWVLLAFLIKIFARAISMGRISLSDVNFWYKWVSFLRPEWEEQQLKKMMESSQKVKSKFGDEPDFSQDQEINVPAEKSFVEIKRKPQSLKKKSSNTSDSNRTA